MSAIQQCCQVSATLETCEYVSYLALVLSNVLLCCTDDSQTQDAAPHVIQDAVLLLVGQLSAIFKPPVDHSYPLFQTQTDTATSLIIFAGLLYLTRGKGMASVEQVNCMSSPSIRQPLSSRHTNLGGAGQGGKNRNKNCGTCFVSSAMQHLWTHPAREPWPESRRCPWCCWHSRCTVQSPEQWGCPGWDSSFLSGLLRWCGEGHPPEEGHLRRGHDQRVSEKYVMQHIVKLCAVCSDLWASWPPVLVILWLYRSVWLSLLSLLYSQTTASQTPVGLVDHSNIKIKRLKTESKPVCF